MRVCDVCGGPAVGDPVKFGWGSSFYETDLCEEHASVLVDTVEAVIKNARRMGAGVSSAPTPPLTSTPLRAPRVDTKEVRAWAKKQGIEVSDKGRVPDSLIQQFLSATRSA